MCRRLFANEFALDLGRERDGVVYVGDSPNDAPMFDFFPCSIGVANLRRFAALIATPPKYVTQASCGAGFAEVVAHLLAS
jgi:hypothetical protein